MFRILVVDDDKNIRFVFHEVLESVHYTVFCAKDADEGLSILEREHIDLCIVDIMMPRKDGYDFTSTVRDANAKMPILMVSAKQLPEDRKRGFVVGIDDYMAKPIDPEELLLHVKALLRRAGAQSEHKLIFGGLILDYDSYTVSGHGEVKELPQKEFLLLYKLLSYPGKIFTKIQLMDEIWGMDCDTGWETLTVHIARLRKRFEGFSEFEIENVRGLGYKAVVIEK